MTPITKDLLTQAIMTAHHECRGSEEGCIHAAAVSECTKLVDRTILRAIEALSDEPEADEARIMLSVFFHGMHVGYRLNQLVSLPTSPVDDKDAN